MPQKKKSGWRGFLQRHKKKAIFGSIVAGGSLLYLGYQYYQSMYPSQSEKARELFVTRMKYSYDNNRRTTNSALRSSLHLAEKALMEALDVDEVIAQLKQAKSKEESRALWEQVKSLGFGRSVAAAFTVPILHLFLGIQVNLIARYLFLRHMQEENEKLGIKAKEEAIILTEKSQQDFLSYINFFQQHGVKKLSQIVKKKVEEILNPIELQRPFTKLRLIELIQSMRIACEEEISDHIQEILLPPESQDQDEDVLVRCLLDEMRDILESDPYKQILLEAFRTSFQLLCQNTEQTVNLTDNDSTVHLATVTPKITKEFKAFFDPSVSNEYVSRLHDDNMNLVRYFATVYSNNVKL